MRAEQVTVQDLVRAAADLGLDPGEVVFEFVAPDVLYRIAAYGFPRNYAHWSFGRAFWLHKADHDRGRSRLYELVLKDEPAVAYLSDDNTPLETVFVQAHVIGGHADLFRRNRLCRAMPSGMIARARAARERFEAYEQLYGAEAVEQVIDAGHALRCTVYPDRPYWETLPTEGYPRPSAPVEFPGMDLYPDEEVERRRLRKLVQEVDNLSRRFFGLDERDLLLWATTYPALEDWKRDILTVIREQELYHRAIRLTKCLHESWSVFNHLRILRALDLPEEETVAYARMHANVVFENPLGINPYAVGLKLFQVLERRGEDLLAITAHEDDASLFRNWLDEEIVQESRLYIWEADRPVQDPRTGHVLQPLRHAQRRWEDVRAELVRAMEEQAQPSLPVRLRWVHGLPLAHPLPQFVPEELRLAVEAEGTVDGVRPLSWPPLYASGRAKGLSPLPNLPSWLRPVPWNEGGLWWPQFHEPAVLLEVRAEQADVELVKREAAPVVRALGQLCSCRAVLFLVARSPVDGRDRVIDYLI